MLDNLSFSRFKAYFRVLDEVRLSSYAGSTLRGALGYALKKVRYGMKKNCPECPLRSECRYGSLYDYLFESPADHPFIIEAHRFLDPRQRRENYPQPFVIEPPPGGSYASGEILSLPFTLIGRAVSCFPFIACALSLMGSNGLGEARGRAFLEAIVDGFPSFDGGETCIYDGRSERIVGPGEVLDFGVLSQWVEESFPSEQRVGEIRVTFLTPFRFKHEDRLGGAVTFSILMRNLFRRLTLLSVHSPVSSPIDYKSLLSLAEAVQTKESNLVWHDLKRYSTRQKKDVKFGGFLGDIVFRGDLKAFLPYLKAGEYLNIGKSTSFGHGKFELAFLR